MTFKKALHEYEETDIEFDDYYGTSDAIYHAYVGLSKCYKMKGLKNKTLQTLLKAVKIIKDIRKHTGTDYYWSLELDAYIQLGKKYLSSSNEEMALFYHEKSIQCLKNSH